MAAEESRSLVFTYDLKRQTIFVDEQTARTFGVAEVQPDVPYGMVGRGIVSEDTVDEYIRIHEEILNGGLQAEGIVKRIPVDFYSGSPVSSLSSESSFLSSLEDRSSFSYRSGRRR